MSFNPIVDRLVTFKVSSSDVEVTDELHARFFREAQACAELNHPNTVTVYDIGRDRGSALHRHGAPRRRRTVAADRAPGAALTLEDKGAEMLQVSSGLHYACQKGVREAEAQRALEARRSG
jgi:serine/threonine protein kinase